ncbi:MAG TPA: recombinase family protein [Phycisphaerales bacterium]|nr:recombinase family protein [Phycisphaerales bacterium]
MEPQRFFLYARKSTDDASHQVRSIDDQIAELRDLARARGLVVVDTLIEKQTAKKPGRPVFNDMLARLERYEASGILAWHPDRLARNALDGGRVIHMVDMGVIKNLVFPTCPFDPTPTGKFMLSIMFGQSKYYVDNLGENIRRGHRRKLADGIWPAFTPIGYLNDRATRTIGIDPVRGPMVQELFRLYATGLYTLDQLTQVARTQNLLTRAGDPLSRTQIHKMLTNTLYCGILKWKDEVHEGRHEPLVSAELFDQVEHVISGKSKPRGKRLKSYTYRGVFRCGECGCFVTTETQKGHNYLRCTKRVKRDCSQPYVREEVVTLQVSDAIASFALPGDTADWIVTELQAEERRGQVEASTTIHEVQAAMHEVDGRVSRLTDAYLAKALTIEEFQEGKARLIAEKQSHKDRLAAVEASRGNWFEPAIRFVLASKQAAKYASEGTEPEKRDFIKKVSSNLTIRDKRLEIEARGAWKLVANQGVFAHHDKTAPCSGAVSPHGECRHDRKRRGGDSNPR